MAFSGRHVAVDLTIVQILQRALLASALGKHHVFVAMSAVLVGKVVQDIDTDEIGTVYDRHLQYAAYPTMQRPGVLVASFVIAVDVDLGMEVRIEVARAHRAQERRNDRQIECHQVTQRTSPNETAHVRYKIEIACMLQST